MNTSPPPEIAAAEIAAPEIALEIAAPDLPPARTGGFTLTRLLIVIALVGTLSALVAPMLFPAQP